MASRFNVCFALLPLVLDRLREDPGSSIALCISPLPALMMEQRTKFSIRGLSSEFVGELQQDVDAIENVKKGRVQLLYITV